MTGKTPRPFDPDFERIVAESPSLRRDWAWNHQPGRHDGVHTFEGKLVWYTQPDHPHAGGGAHEQSFADFLRDGPWVSDVPKEILDEIREVVRQIVSLLSRPP
ncbi:MAG: hypothetical protein HYY06_30225 [Deltaproteobacteria bacterium]|nr:hypothetical protein [Deltaproteobacteria bacterium]